MIARCDVELIRIRLVRRTERAIRRRTGRQRRRLRQIVQLKTVSPRRRGRRVVDDQCVVARYEVEGHRAGLIARIGCRKRAVTHHGTARSRQCPVQAAVVRQRVEVHALRIAQRKGVHTRLRHVSGHGAAQRQRCAVLDARDVHAVIRGRGAVDLAFYEQGVHAAGAQRDHADVVIAGHCGSAVNGRIVNRIGTKLGTAIRIQQPPANVARSTAQIGEIEVIPIARGDGELIGIRFVRRIERAVHRRAGRQRRRLR